MSLLSALGPVLCWQTICQMKMIWPWKSRTLCFWTRKSKTLWLTKDKISGRLIRLGICCSPIGVSISTLTLQVFLFWNWKISLSDHFAPDLKESRADSDKIYQERDPTSLQEQSFLQIQTSIPVRLSFHSSCQRS